MRYPIAIEPGDENTAFGVVVPDLPGCIATGKTRKQVEKNMQEAMEFHIEGLSESGQPIPLPASSSEYVEVRALDVNCQEPTGPEIGIDVFGLERGGIFAPGAGGGFGLGDGVGELPFAVEGADVIQGGGVSRGDANEGGASEREGEFHGRDGLKGHGEGI